MKRNNVYLDDKNQIIPDVGDNEEIKKLAIDLKGRALSGIPKPEFKKESLMPDFGIITLKEK